MRKLGEEEKWRLTIFIDARALHPTGHKTSSLCATLTNDLGAQFPNAEVKFKFFGRSSDLAIESHREVALWTKLQKKICIGQESNGDFIFADPRDILAFEDLENAISSLPQGNLYFIVSPEYEYFSAADFLVLPVTRYGELCALGEANFEEVLKKTNHRKTRVFLDVDSTILDCEASRAQMRCILNQACLEQLTKFSKTDTTFNLITSRTAYPDKGLMLSNGTHEKYYQIMQSSSDQQEIARATALSMQAVLSALKAELMKKGFSADCLNQEVIYTSATCLKLSGIYWFLESQGYFDTELQIIVMIDDLFTQLDRDIPELDLACRKFEDRAVQVHRLMTCSAGIYTSPNFDALCEQLKQDYAFRLVERPGC